MGRASTHVALLRGINVGGRNKLPMAQLRSIFEELGAQEVRTYIQSGNVVFRGDAAFAASLPALASAAILKQAKLAVPVLTRSLTQLKKIGADHPLGRPGDEPRLLHVVFLGRKPSAAQLKSLEPSPSPADEMLAKGANLYVRYAAGAGKTKITNAWLERRLKTQTTARNWRTVHKLIELATA